MTFTPAPWRVSGTGAIMATGGHIIAMPVDLPLNEKLAETQRANNHLIASAPELHEMLTIALGVIDKAGIIWMGEEKAKAVLARAVQQ